MISATSLFSAMRTSIFTLERWSDMAAEFPIVVADTVGRRFPGRPLGVPGQMKAPVETEKPTGAFSVMYTHRGALQQVLTEECPLAKVFRRSPGVPRRFHSPDAMRQRRAGTIASTSLITIGLT